MQEPSWEHPKVSAKVDELNRENIEGETSIPVGHNAETGSPSAKEMEPILEKQILEEITGVELPAAKDLLEYQSASEDNSIELLDVSGGMVLDDFDNPVVMKDPPEKTSLKTPPSKKSSSSRRRKK
ncbi:hypothetical protein U1Q18_040325, partial [Sarracenia purpurea var. burkii]